MTIDIHVTVTDDQAMHRQMLKTALRMLSERNPHFVFSIDREFADGAELLQHADEVQAALLTLDIRMPQRDGLSTLLLLRRRHHIRTPVCMVSAESEANIERFSQTVPEHIRSLPFKVKIEHMQKIEERILNDVQEPGKINSLLAGCEKLALDPMRYAEYLGANGFLQKPYSPDAVSQVIPEVINGKTFSAAHCLQRH